MKKLVPTLTLFASLSTLFCCALPALLVTLGLGAVMAGLVSSVPQIIWFSEHKTGLFIFAGVMLSISGFFRWRERYASCPADPQQAAACARLRRVSHAVFWFSLVIYMTGLFFAYIAPGIGAGP